MYSKNNLYKFYIKNIDEEEYSSKIPDVTKKITLENLNLAINTCDKWDYFLDIGAGSGHYARPLIEKFRNGVAIEIEPNNKLKELEESNKTFKVFNKPIEEVELESKMDFVSLIDVFEHIKDPEKLTEKISRMQETGGVVFIIIPNTFYCGPAKEGEIYYKKTPFGHIKHYTDKEMIDFFEKYNYKVIYSKYIENNLSQKIRKIIRGLSRRDKKISNKFIYKIIKPFILFLYYPISKILEFIIYKIELNTKEYNSRSRVLVFKKY